MKRALAALLDTRSGARVAALAGLLLALALGEGAALLLLLAALNAYLGTGPAVLAPLGGLAGATSLPIVLVAFVAVAALVAALQYVARRETTAIRLDYLHQRRMALFASVRRANWIALADRPASGLRYGFNELTSATSYALDLSLQALVSLALFFIGFVLALLVDARITGLMVLAGVLTVIPFRLAERRAAAMSARESESQADLYQRLDQSLADVKFLKFQGSQDSAANRVERDSRDQIAALDRLHAGSSAVAALYAVVSSVVMAIALLSAWLLGATPQTLLMLAVIAGRLFPRVTTLVSVSRQLAELDARWIELEALSRELDGAADPPADPTGLAVPVSTVAVDKVSFAYPTSRGTVLSDVSFELRRGKATGLVGLTGAGKTTTVDLVCGLLMPDRGEVRLDGRPLRASLGEAWRERIALVDQDSTVLSASLRENLALRRPDATDREIGEACETVGLAGLVSRLPKGLDTFLGDNGRLLSRGERQRVSLARALLQRPDLLILDEATASLNPLDEAAIIEAIARRRDAFATLTVAHRVSALRWVDDVLVLSGSHIVERGRPDDLLRDPASLLSRMAAASSNPHVPGADGTDDGR